MADLEEKANAEESTDATVSKTPPKKVAPLPGMLAEGTKVRVKQPVIEGVVDEYHLSADKKTFSYLVTYKDSNGEEHQRAYSHDQLEEIE